MSVHRVLLVVCSALLIATTGWAGSRPVAVSPGSPTGSVIGDACPTFSWGSVNGAKSYELVVYRIGAEGEEAEPVLRQAIAGSALGWTPSLDLCLERSGQYAWSVRAVEGRDEVSEWSSPYLFEVVSGPSGAEFEEALQVVRQYLAGQSEREATQGGAPSPSSESRRTPPAAMPQAAVAPAETKLSVDGNVDAVSFTGDGSGLSGLATSQALCTLYSKAGGIPTSEWPSFCKFVFVTSGEYQGNLGGLAGGDMKCQDLADTAGLPGTFKAWLSDSTTDAKDRFSEPTGPWFLVGDGSLVASDLTDLLDCSNPDCLSHSIDRTETGGNPTPTPGAFIWTGTGSDGTVPGQVCDDWSSDFAGSSIHGFIGQSTQSNSSWTIATSTDGCDHRYAIYCFQE